MTTPIERQVQWAANCNIPVESGYCTKVESNLPWLTEAIRSEVGAGDGNELGRPGQRARIAALHSSAALGVNFFGYWKGRSIDPLIRPLSLDASVDNIVFERKFPTGVGPRSPNMDMTIEMGNGASILAIESKFTEWFGTSGRKPLRDTYLQPGRKRWRTVGLSGAQQTAEAYLDAPGFSHLDVPQLLKHMLGLASQSAKWRLLLLWYDWPGEESAEMHKQIERFKLLLGDDAQFFSAITYQKLWDSMAYQLGPDHITYREYMAKRYF